jgi:hypothetical protein
LEEEVSTSLIARTCEVARQHLAVDSRSLNPKVRGYALQIISLFESERKGTGRLKRAVKGLMLRIRQSLPDGKESEIKSERVYVESAEVHVHMALVAGYRTAVKELQARG